MSDLLQLLDGYRKFHRHYYVAEPELYKSLSQDGQHPKTLIVGCSDSRVDPAIVTQAEPGEIFMVRNVANLVPAFGGAAYGNSVGAAMEYALLHLGIAHIVVLGHSQCGGIKALLEGGVEASDCLQGWIAGASAAKEIAETRFRAGKAETLAQACEQSSILHSLDNLMTYPWIAEHVDRRALTLHGWYFDLSSGVLQCYDKESDRFVCV